MRERERSDYREAVVIALVLLGHAVLVWLFVRARHVEYVAEPPARTTLFFIDTAVPRPTAPAPAQPASPSLRIEVAPPVPPSSSPVDQDAVETPAANAPKLIDWQNEARRSASALIDERTQPGPRSFGPVEVTPLPTKPREFDWNPEPQTISFAGLLPYVHVGKRCVIGLGFFACGIGEMPAANGALFDGMSDPDRPSSSVPESQQ